jgi:hypothetical protein
LFRTKPRNRATAQPRNRATAQPRNRALVQGVLLPEIKLLLPLLGIFPLAISTTGQISTNPISSAHRVGQWSDVVRIPVAG